MMGATSPRGLGRRHASVLAIVFVLLVSSVALPGVVAASPTAPPPTDQVIHVKDGVSVWERAAFPLRADTSNAAWTVPNALWTLQDQHGNTRNLGKSEVGVYRAGTDVTLTFDDARASFAGGMDDRQVTLVAARITGPNAVPDVSTAAGAIDLLTGPHANQNADFELVGRTHLNGGSATFTHTVDTPGNYVYLLATNESGHDGLQVDANGDLAIDGNVTVVGVEDVAVQAADASVQPSSRTVPAGNDVTMNLDSNLDGSNGVQHAIVLYREDTFDSQQFRVALDRQPGPGFSVADDVTLSSTIASVDGEGRVDGPVSALGVTVGDGQVSGSAGVGGIVDFIANELSQQPPDVQTTGDTVLPASAVVFSGDSNPNPVTISTHDGWEPGTYRYIYVAREVGTTRTSTATGTIEVVAPGKSGTAGGSGSTGVDDTSNDNGNTNDNNDNDNTNVRDDGNGHSNDHGNTVQDTGNVTEGNSTNATSVTGDSTGTATPTTRSSASSGGSGETTTAVTTTTDDGSPRRDESGSGDGSTTVKPPTGAGPLQAISGSPAGLQMGGIVLVLVILALLGGIAYARRRL